MWSDEAPLVSVSMDEILCTSCMVVGRRLARERCAGTGSRIVSRPDLKLDPDLDNPEDPRDGEE